MRPPYIPPRDSRKGIGAVVASLLTPLNRPFATHRKDTLGGCYKRSNYTQHVLNDVLGEMVQSLPRLHWKLAPHPPILAVHMPYFEGYGGSEDISYGGACRRSPLAFREAALVPSRVTLRQRASATINQQRDCGASSAPKG
jgi:hypothetical protein